MSPKGYMAISGTQAPWSRPREGCWYSDSPSGMAPATRCAREVASGVSYVIV